MNKSIEKIKMAVDDVTGTAAMSRIVMYHMPPHNFSSLIDTPKELPCT